MNELNDKDENHEIIQVENNPHDNLDGYVFEDNFDDNSNHEDCNSTNNISDTTALTDFQRARIERNRQKALLLKQSKLAKRQLNTILKEPIVKKTIDSGAGFLIEEDEIEPANKITVVQQSMPLVLSDKDLHCEECNKKLTYSFLLEKFDAEICDNCRDRDVKHRLITRTDAKEKYLLKDVDLDKREPILKFILKKNTSYSKFGEMKLYLELQIAERAYDVWGSEEALEKEKTRREALREIAKKKKFDKKLADLKRNVRSSLYKKQDTIHKHEFGEENYNEKTDEYSKSCISCSHTLTYEKM